MCICTYIDICVKRKCEYIPMHAYMKRTCIHPYKGGCTEVRERVRDPTDVLGCLLYRESERQSESGSESESESERGGERERERERGKERERERVRDGE